MQAWLIPGIPAKDCCSRLIGILYQPLRKYLRKYGSGVEHLKLYIWFSGNRRGRGVLWGCFAGFARKTPPHMPFVTATPNEPKVFGSRGTEKLLALDVGAPPKVGSQKDVVNSEKSAFFSVYAGELHRKRPII